MASIKYGPTIVTDGLVTYLDAANIESYPESGTTWTDIVSGHNASLNGGGVSWTQPKNGFSYAITLAGITNPSYIVNTTLPGGDSSFTIEMWVYHNGTDQAGSFGVYSGGGNYGPLIYSHNAGMTTGHYFPGSPSGDYFTNGAVTVNNDWVQFVYGYDNIVGSGGVETFRGWKNGDPYHSYTTSDFHNSGHGRGSPGYVLGGYTASGQPYKGSYGSFRYYNRQLTDAEVKQNYDAQRTRYGV